jgi:hypothetical protein
MSPADNIEQRIRELRFRTGPEADDRILSDALAALEQARTTLPDTTRASVWRIIMTSRWTKIIPAAAAIIAITVVAVTVLNKSATPAYSLEQTVEANRGLRYIHIKIDPARFDHMSEAWLQLNAEGQPVRMKMDYPATMDGPKVVLWQDNNKAEVWFKKKKGVGVFHDPKIVASFPIMLKMFDPIQVIDELYKAQAEGKVSIETTMPVSADDPITLTATSLPGKGLRTVYLVDAETKLLTRVQRYSPLSWVPRRTSCESTRPPRSSGSPRATSPMSRSPSKWLASSLKH